MKKNKIIAILIVLVSFFAFSCSSSKNLAVDEVAEQENLSQNQLEEEVDEEKSDEKKSEKNKNYLGWEKTSNRPIDYTNGIVNIRIKPKLGSFCFYVINEDEKQRAREIELLEYESDQINEADIKLNEEDELVAKKKVLLN